MIREKHAIITPVLKKVPQTAWRTAPYR